MIPTSQVLEDVPLTSRSTGDLSRRRTLMTNRPGEQPDPHWAEAKYGPALATAVPGKGNAAPWTAKRVAEWSDGLGSQTVTLKCDKPAILALAQEDSKGEEKMWDYHPRAP